MKKLFDIKMVGSILLMLTIFLTSCDGYWVTQPTPSIKYQFKKDLVDVKVGSFAVDDTTLTILLEPAANNILIVHGFTSIERYVEYGTKKGLKTKLEVEVLKHLARYADSMDVEAITLATGQVPSWYTDYTTSYVASKFGLSLTSLQTRNSLSTTVYEDYIRGGRSMSFIPFRTTYAWLGLYGFSQNISSFYPSGLIGGCDVVFAKSFFRKPIFRYWSNSWSQAFEVNFDGYFLPYNNKAASWIPFGL